jgi:hypothetical protein
VKNSSTFAPALKETLKNVEREIENEALMTTKKKKMKIFLKSLWE